MGVITSQLQLRTVLQFMGILIVLLFLITYAVFQARYLIIGPQIVLSTDLKPVQNERQIFLEGTAYNISRLWLNDRPIYTDAQGTFKEALVLENGYTISTLRAEDRYGRNTTLSQAFVYTPASFIE